VYTRLWVRAKIFCCDKTTGLVKIGGQKILETFATFENIIEKTFINWRALPLIKINTRISGTACILKANQFK
jgi:hypothetical protein